MFCFALLKIGSSILFNDFKKFYSISAIHHLTRKVNLTI